MKQKIVYIGLDVDDTQYHGSALDKESGELLSFRCRPTLKGLLGQLAKIRKHFPGHTLKLAYEASYIGFTLQRDLAEQGICCDVVAPSSIPRKGGKAVSRASLSSNNQSPTIGAPSSSVLPARTGRSMSLFVFSPATRSLSRCTSMTLTGMSASSPSRTSCRASEPFQPSSCSD